MIGSSEYHYVGGTFFAGIGLLQHKLSGDWFGSSPMPLFWDLKNFLLFFHDQLIPLTSTSIEFKI